MFDTLDQFLLTMYLCVLVQCAPGTYSDNGVEPCSPCTTGTYQNETGQIFCLPCPGQESTHGTGASSLDYCTGETSFLNLKRYISAQNKGERWPYC